MTAIQSMASSPTNIELTQLEEENGTGANTYTAANEYDLGSEWLRWDILIETFDAFISFLKNDGNWSDDKPLPPGIYSLDFSATGLRIRNRIAGNNTIYSFTRYR